MTDESSDAIPVVDLFAGPGGLGEGFASCHHLSGGNDEPVFKVALSVEKDKYAHETLLIRSFVRKFAGDPPPEYDEFLAGGGRKGLEDLFEAYPEQAAAAQKEARHLTLGSEDVHQEVLDRIHSVTWNGQPWVLVGGPPCQAYSIAGRSRNKGKQDYRPEDDERHFLYREFLKVLAETAPPVFLLENVKGLVSATVKDQRIFEQMLRDLQHPVQTLPEVELRDDLSYEVLPVISNGAEQQTLLDASREEDLQRYVVHMENYGIPQTRHRLFLLGVQSDLAPERFSSLEPADDQIPVERVIDGLPELRSGLSRREDSFESWVEVLQRLPERAWFPEDIDLKTTDSRVSQKIREIVGQPEELPGGRGGNYLSVTPEADFAREWYLRSEPDTVLNHEARAHMDEDLHRYLFAAVYASVYESSPVLGDFPKQLLPNHKSVDQALEEGGYFSDRFRVQRRGRPATTVTSHIAKDGHYYIHYDPKQCRSLTVREAARIQTFPDDYFFAGPRTAQYTQVGNAVPPLLAARIAKRIAEGLEIQELT